MELSKAYLKDIKPNYLAKGYPVPKWIKFSEAMLDLGCEVELHESKSTVSKYLYISKDKNKFKVRFSNHKANYGQEMRGDCDFYVGVGNKGFITTEQLIEDLEGIFSDKKKRTNKEIAERVIHNRRVNSCQNAAVL